MSAGRRYALEPLLAISGWQPTPLQRHLRVSGTTWHKYLTEGMSAETADRFASRAGFHPAEVWPTWMDDALEEQMKPCATCGEPFLPARRNVLYCGQRCRRLVQQRRYRAHPEVAEKNRQRRRAAYAETAEYERARQRRYYAENRDAIIARRRARAESQACSSTSPGATLHVETSAPGAASTAPELVNPWLEESTMADVTSPPSTREDEAA